MYSDPATFIIDSVDGGVISSLTINDGGRLFTSGEIITIPGGDGRAQFQVDSVQQSGPEASYDILATRAYAEEEKTNSVYFSLDRTLEYSTSHAIAISDVYNMAWESTSHTSTVTTIAAPEPCPPITSILFEAWGSGQQELSPQTEEEWIYKHEDNSFIYYQDGISWEEFISKLNTTIAVPDSVTAPDLVYVWYKEGKYLLGDAAWMVGIIGSETGYDGSSYQYVLYSLDMIGETLQLAPSGTSTYQCGTIEWGGNWGDSIQQFKLNRN
jgi:hypothetical protein